MRGFLGPLACQSADITTAFVGRQHQGETGLDNTTFNPYDAMTPFPSRR